MTRIVKEYVVRRNEILDAAQRLIYTKGYEQMTIQDILDDLHIAKGLVYYYFDSKQVLLTALIERMMGTIEQLVSPIIDDPDLHALEKFQRLFATLSHWETEQKIFIAALLRVWYTDDNAIVREKARVMTVKRIAPLFTVIIRQGIEEGAMTTDFPDLSGEVALSLFQGLEETIAGLLLSVEEPSHDILQRIETAVAAYTAALGRTFGFPPDSLHLINAETLKAWLALFRDAE
jgi:AcrR family transcriptional regulator